MARWDFDVIGKKLHVTEPELLSASLGASMVGVFPDAEKKIESEECKFPCGAKSAVACGARVLEDVVGDLDGDSDLWLGGGVTAFIGFHLEGHGGMVVGGSWLV